MSSDIKKISCSFCDFDQLEEIIDFGEMALAGGFLTKDNISSEIKYPMRLGYCKNCFSVQIMETIDPDILFKDYFYFSSSINTLKDHFSKYAEEVYTKFLGPSSKVLEFGCNDGVFLKPMANYELEKVIGVDPAENVISTIQDKRIHTICDYFNESVAESVLDKFGSIDLIVSNNAYAHIEDIQGTTRAVKKALKKDGVFSFEVHYLGEVIENLQYDMIYHEHIYYYSLISAIEHFKRYDMIVFDIKPISIHGGSYRFYVCNEGARHSMSESPKVFALKQKEKELGYDHLSRYLSFSNQIHSLKEELNSLLIGLKDKGKKIAGYGASGRANTILQFCELDAKKIEFMIDDAPAKQGYYTPGSHLEIKSNEILSSDDAPDYVIVFAWAFFDEIKKKNKKFLEKGGKFILPLPKVSVYPNN